MRLPKPLIKDKRRALLAVVAGLGFILLAYGILRATGLYRLPPRLDKELPNYIIFAAFAAFLYGRQLAREEEKAAKKEADEGTSEGGAEPGEASVADDEGEADHRG
jgi:hypothetical protein